MIQNVSPSSPSQMGVCRGSPLRRPTVSSSASPGGDSPNRQASRTGVLMAECCNARMKRYFMLHTRLRTGRQYCGPGIASSVALICSAGQGSKSAPSATKFLERLHMLFLHPDDRLSSAEQRQPAILALNIVHVVIGLTHHLRAVAVDHSILRH